MSLAFIGGAGGDAQEGPHRVELLSNLMEPGPLRGALLALVDFITLGLHGLMRYFSVTIVERHAFASR
jgi:hypothetical protein